MVINSKNHLDIWAVVEKLGENAYHVSGIAYIKP